MIDATFPGLANLAALWPANDNDPDYPFGGASPFKGFRRDDEAERRANWWLYQG